MHFAGSNGLLGCQRHSLEVTGHFVQATSIPVALVSCSYYRQHLATPLKRRVWPVLQGRSACEVVCACLEVRAARINTGQTCRSSRTWLNRNDRCRSGVPGNGKKTQKINIDCYLHGNHPVAVLHHCLWPVIGSAKPAGRSLSLPKPAFSACLFPAQAACCRIVDQEVLFGCGLFLRTILVVVVVLLEDIESKAPGLVVGKAAVIRDDKLYVQVVPEAFLEVREFLV